MGPQAYQVTRPGLSGTNGTLAPPVRVFGKQRRGGAAVDGDDWSACCSSSAPAGGTQRAAAVASMVQGRKGLCLLLRRRC